MYMYMYISSGHLSEVKNNRKFKTVNPQSGCVYLITRGGLFQEFSTAGSLPGNWYFGKVVIYEMWLHTGGGRTGS